MATRGGPPAYQALAEKLRERILSGELAPGQRLPIEPELSAEYGVSRSTVREALRVLASQNLVSTSRGVLGGSFVAHPQPNQISSYLQVSLSLLTGTSESDITVEDLMEARELLEVPAAGLAALRRTTVHLEALQLALTRRPMTEPYLPSMDFHAALVRGSGNPLMEVLIRAVYGVLGERLPHSGMSDEFWLAMGEDHRRIYEAVRAGDAEAARQTTRAHLRALRPAYALPPRPRDRS